MTVEELVAELQKLHPKAVVFVDSSEIKRVANDTIVIGGKMVDVVTIWSKRESS